MGSCKYPPVGQPVPPDGVGAGDTKLQRYNLADIPRAYAISVVYSVSSSPWFCGCWVREAALNGRNPGCPQNSFGFEDENQYRSANHNMKAKEQKTKRRERAG